MLLGQGCNVLELKHIAQQSSAIQPDKEHFIEKFLFQNMDVF